MMNSIPCCFSTS